MDIPAIPLIVSHVLFAAFSLTKWKSKLIRKTEEIFRPQLPEQKVKARRKILLDNNPQQLRNFRSFFQLFSRFYSAWRWIMTEMSSESIIHCSPFLQRSWNNQSSCRGYFWTRYYRHSELEQKGWPFFIHKITLKSKPRLFLALLFNFAQNLNFFKIVYI